MKPTRLRTIETVIGGMRDMKERLKVGGYLAALLLGAALWCCNVSCYSQSAWLPQTGATLTDCERVMGRPASISGNEARWFLNGNLEAYAEFDRPLIVRGVLIYVDGELRARMENEWPRTVAPMEWYGEAYNCYDRRQ